MFLPWNINNRICRVCDGDPFKRYLPFASSSCAKDERHVYSQRVSSSRRDSFPSSSSSWYGSTYSQCSPSLPISPHIITPLSLRQLTWWEKKEGWRQRDGSCGPPVECVSFIRDGGMQDEKRRAYTPWLLRCRRGTSSEGLTYRTLLIIMALIKKKGGWYDSTTHFIISLSVFFFTKVSAFSTWEKELHKIVFDPRYLLLNPKERKQVHVLFILSIYIYIYIII